MFRTYSCGSVPILANTIHNHGDGGGCPNAAPSARAQGRKQTAGPPRVLPWLKVPPHPGERQALGLRAAAVDGEELDLRARDGVQRRGPTSTCTTAGLIKRRRL